MLVSVVAVFSAFLALVLLASLVLFQIVRVCVWRRRRFCSTSNDDDEVERGRELRQDGIARRHHVAEALRNPNYYLFRRGAAPFSWAERGSPRIAFAAAVQSSPSVKSLLASCEEIRLNLSAVEMIRAGLPLPLPRPNLGNSSFPQEAYFEVTVVACGGGGSEGRRERRARSEGDDRLQFHQRSLSR
ncbi:uncharacterized protein LOC125202659 [Salvia hispanica]|uniref:uncharacterized protein LOC125202659 n=1 Tax=Salvia hispanica TaxID=49212 RepID=UPI002009D422|nr:uncharacterized protein LOC125202659 [Salvia hispanica]